MLSGNGFEGSGIQWNLADHSVLKANWTITRVSDIAHIRKGC